MKKTLLIIAIKKVGAEGLTICFNEPFALNGRMAVKEWDVSWDRIGKALCGEKYCDATEVGDLNKIRAITLSENKIKE